MSGIATIIIQPILIFIETDLIKFSNQQTRTIFRNLLIYFWIVIAKYVQTLLVTRIILIFANIRRAQQSDHNWKSIIDPNYKNQTNEYQEPSWIIKYFYIVGNPTYLLCIFTIYWLFEIICGLFVIFFNQGSFITFLDRFLMFFIVAAITGDLQLCIGGYFVYNIRKSLSYDNLYIWIGNCNSICGWIGISCMATGTYYCVVTIICVFHLLVVSINSLGKQAKQKHKEKQK